ncbi:MAG: hypothetical protein MZW92_30550 [Comamonadaceae bacterium]|nr:hypothetical protein [Comamonadaceae bacterium]
MPHTVIADNAGGHLMQRGAGRPRASSAATASTRRGDVCNKIGTYLKALAAHDNGVPFYVAMPTSTHRPATLADGVREIPIEERSRARGDAHRAAATRDGRSRRGAARRAAAAPAANPAFDVTPARLVTRPDHRARRRAGRAQGAARAVSAARRSAE